MSSMLKWQNSIERAKMARSKQKERRRDIQDLKDRDMWNDPRNRYLDEYGYPLSDAPQWWLNLRKAWKTNDRKSTLEMAVRPLKSEEPTAVPLRKKRYKKIDRKPKLKHSEKMKLLLEDHGIYVRKDGMLSDEFSDWKFCVNGKLLDTSKPNLNTISVFYFLQHYADT